MRFSPLAHSLLLLSLLVATGCSRENDATPRPDSIRVADTPAVIARSRFTVVRVDTRSERLALFLQDDSSRTFHRFDTLQAWLARRGERLLFAMNAGMYEPDFSPVGLLVQEGREISPLNLSDGKGNFYLKPNGIFLIDSSGAPKVVASTEYPDLAKKVRLATQSGPLLVRNGVVHPEFNRESTSRLIRNGVGVSGDTAIFVISEQPVTFHEFATFFRDSLHCPDALYLDGVVSSLYSIGLRRNDDKTALGPIIAVVE